MWSWNACKSRWCQFRSIGWPLAARKLHDGTCDCWRLDGSSLWPKICGRVTAAVRFPFFDPYLQSIYVMGPVIVSDWTQSLTKYLREQLQKIQEHYHSGANGPQTSFLLANHNSQADMEHAVKQWGYCTRLAKHMYNVSHVHGKVSHQVHNFWKGKINKDREVGLFLQEHIAYELYCAFFCFVGPSPETSLFSKQTPQKKHFVLCLECVQRENHSDSCAKLGH